MTGIRSKKQFRFDDDTWTHLGADDKLVEKIETEKFRRCRTGESAREKAQKLFVEAPGVLGDILHDKTASPRHRIEASKELRVVADNGPQAAQPDVERFVIRINLGNDEVLKIDKQIAPTPQTAMSKSSSRHSSYLR
jgi:hypothetical protein